MTAPFLENDNVYYGVTCQLYERFEGGSLDYLTPSQQHQYRQDGYVTAPRYGSSDGANYKPEYYSDDQHGGYEEYRREIYERKEWARLYGDPAAKKRDFFDDDDWSKPLYDKKMLDGLGDGFGDDFDDFIDDDFDEPVEEPEDEQPRQEVKPQPATPEQRGEEHVSCYYEASFLFTPTGKALTERGKEIVAARTNFANSLKEYGATDEECNTLLHMMLHQEWWWESKQIRYNT